MAVAIIAGASRETCRVKTSLTRSAADRERKSRSMSADDLALVRSFNHTVIHWISVLDEGCVHSERGARIPALSSRLELSRRAVSLLLLTLQEVGLVDIDRGASAAQTDWARLTTLGRSVLRAQQGRTARGRSDVQEIRLPRG